MGDYVVNAHQPPTATAPTANGFPPAEAAGWVGDLLVTFETDVPPRAGRPGASWRLAGQGETWRVWQSSPTAGWHGAPLTRVESDGRAAWLLGELYGTARPAADVAAVLDGRASPNTLNGHFLLLAHDAPAGEWHVWTNRHASLHAYVASDGRRVALGTCFRAVAAAAARPDLDWEALTTFFGFGFCAADRTFLRDVGVLRPATHTRFDARGRLLAIERYWQWRREPDTTRSPADTLAEYAERFQAVMDDLLAGDVVIPISGGLDSRSTVAAVNGDTSRLWAFSYGYRPDSVETRIAARVAAARALPFAAFTIPPYLFDNLPRVIGSTEGFHDITLSRQASAVDAIARHGDFVIAAHWGDVYHDAMGVADATPPGDMPAVADGKFRKTGSDWLLRHVAAPHLGGAPDELLRATLAGELRRIGPLDDPDFTLKALKVDQYGPRSVGAALRVYQSAAFPRLPFYDARLVDFFCTVPTAGVAGRRLQIAYLQQYAPDLARVPWQETERDLFSGRQSAPEQLIRRTVRKSRSIITGQHPIQRNWEVQFLGHDGRAGLHEWLLRPGRRLHDLVPIETVGELMAAFDHDPWAEKRSYTVSLLLTLSVWLDYMAGELDR